MDGTMWIGDPDAKVSWTVSAPSSRAASSCAKYCATTFRPSIRVPRSGGSTADSSRMSVDLPAPLGPTSAMRSPRSISTLTSSKTVSVPYAFRTSRSSRTARPLLAALGNVKWTRFRSGGTSIGVIFASTLTRLCTCAAFVAW